MRSTKRIWKLSAILTALLLATACTDGIPDTEQTHQPIVGGTTTSNYPQVGALTYGYSGSSFCTGTLIAPYWVLTAAHCVEGQSASNVYFFVGADANNVGSGSLYPAYDLIPHYGYNPNYYDDDIALVQLSSPVTGITPYLPRSTYMGSNFIGQNLLYVGFGVTDGIYQNGSGVKREAGISVAGVDTSAYWSQYNGTGVCFGDSGGPGLYYNGSNYEVMGVNSTVGNSGSDPCKGYYNHTKVDYYASWISGYTGQEPPDCGQNPSVCACADACQANGTCDNTACQTLSCLEMVECMNACPDNDQGCVSGCYLDGTNQARQQYDDLVGCIYDNCDGLTGDAYYNCIDQNCQQEYDTCLPPQIGDLTCEEMVDCMGGCADGDNACLNDCFNSGTANGQQQYNDVAGCVTDNCGNLTDDAYYDCIAANCATEWDACFTPADCDLTGGDCGPGTACYPTFTGSNDCFPSDENGLGQACDPNQTNTLSCDDGLICLTAGSGGLCFAFCLNDNDCGNAEQCDTSVTSDGSFGICLCIDADDDGFCQASDCDDTDPAIHPDAAELCDDNVDNNCDGDTDEGCSTCTDNDGDGFCLPDDCNDSNPAIHPDATELCNDNVDNNCNGDTNEGCGTCTDNDGDGYCLPDDCNDSNPAIHPDAAELCNDNVDNNCNGDTNEGCGTCTDNDGDGYCLPDDCDDSNPNIKPGASEVCNDGVDNDCDGQTDENCGACTDADGDGYCQQIDCNDTDASIHPNATEICHDSRDNDCDGNTDEGCGSCIDNDQDGSCLPYDCDDAEAMVFPSASELCDARDNNCNGEVDEGCIYKKPASSGCSTSGGGARGSLLTALLMLGLALSLRRRSA